MNNLITISLLIISLFYLPLSRKTTLSESINTPKHTCAFDHEALLKVDTVKEQMFFTIPVKDFPYYFANHPNFKSDGFDFPVGKPDAYNYYKAQNFGDNRHLGEDWNGIGGGNSDLGDPVYSSGNGLVVFAKDVCCGWGKTVRIIHHTTDEETPYIESVYAHLDNISVSPGSLVYRGQKIGSIGTASGRYSAHLHFEMRDFVNMSLGPGYGDDTFGYLAPTKYINTHRPY